MVRNVHKITFGNLNINSLQNKFDYLREIVLKSWRSCFTETKLDDTFPTSQFLVTGIFVLYTLDQTRNEGATITFIRPNIVQVEC